METDGQRPCIQEEDDEDRIVAEGCDLDCAAKDPDLIPTQKHSGWFPDVTRDEDESLRPEVAAEDLIAGSEDDSEYPQVKPAEEKTKEEPSNIEGEWQYEVDTGLSRPDVERSEGQAQEHDETGICEDDQLEDQQMSTSSSAVEANVTWRYFGDDQIHNEAEGFCGQDATDDDLKATEEEECSPLETKEQPKQDEVLVDFGESQPIVDGPPSWQGHGFRDEVISEGEEIREQTEEDRNETATTVDAESYEAQCLATEETTAGNGMTASYSDSYPEGSQLATDNSEVPSELTTFQASEQGLQEDFEEEKAYVDEQKARYWEENARLMTSSADEENRNTLIGYEEVTESSSDVKQPQNGAQLKIYPSQVRKTNNFLSEESQSQDMDARSADEILSPGENENEEEERGLPEQGSVKSLLAQWRQIEQQKRKPGAAKDETEHQQRHRQPLSSGWSQATPEDDDEIQPTKSRVRDEILRMRSQSCDPMASRKHNRLSPNDDDVPSVGKRVGRGRSRMEEEEEAEDAEHYRSQPSLTKAILAKFENLDLQAASSAIKPKSNKVIYYFYYYY